MATDDPATMQAKAAYNTFMTKATVNGNVGVHSVRVQVRQAITEAFARKSVVAAKKIAPNTRVVFSSFNSRGYKSSGPTGLGEAAALTLGAGGHASSKYLGRVRTRSGADASSMQPEANVGLSHADFFNLLTNYATLEASRRQANSVALTSGGVTVASELTQTKPSKGQEAVFAAADSVFEQSLKDVHAISLIAAFDGPEAAKMVLRDVSAARESNGDFGAFSVAPLSHDTRCALEVLKFQIQSGTDFSSMSRDEIWKSSNWIASEGLAAWMQTNGVQIEKANALSSNLEAMSTMLAKSDVGLRPAPNNQPPRPGVVMR